MAINNYNLPVSSTDPPTDAGGVQVYSKLNAGVAQLFARSGDGTIVNVSVGASGMAIGDSISGGTPGSTLFVGAGSLLAQDNTNYFWDNTNKRLGIGTSAPAVALDIAGTGITEAAIQLRTGGSVAVSAANTGRLRYNVTGQKAQWSFNGATYVDVATYAAALTAGSVLFANGSNQIAQDSTNFFWDNTNKRLGIGTNAPAVALDIAGTGITEAAIQLRTGGSVAVSAANTGRTRYNVTGQKWQLSSNGAAYVDIVQVASTGFTAGAVPFATNGNTLTQNATNFNYDNVNVNLNLYTATAGQSPVYTRNTATTGIAGFGALDNAGTFVAYWGYFGSAYAAVTAMQSKHGVLCFNNNNFVLGNSTVGPFEFGMTAGSAFFAMLNGSSAAVSAASTGRLRYNTTGQKAQMSFNGAAYVDVATYAAALTTGSVLFANASNQIAQNNAAFSWTDAAKVLRITQSAADPGDGTGAITLKNTLNTSLVQISFMKDDGTFKGALGYSNSTNTMYLFAPGVPWTMTTGDVGFANSTRTEVTIGMTTGSTYVQLQNGSGAAVSAASTGRLRYNTTGQKAQWSFNGAAYVDVATYAAALTTGSVLFANASNQIAQDNTNFFWDNTNKRVGIGTAAPTRTLDLKRSISGDGLLTIENNAADGYSDVVFNKSDSTIQFALGYGNATAGITHLRNVNFFYSAAGTPVDFVMANATKVEFLFGMVDGSTQLQMANGSGAAVSAANTGRLVYTTTGQKYQVSKNGAAYEDVATLATQQTFTKSQNVASVALTDAANIATNAANGNTFTVTLGGNRTLDNPTNLVAGGIYNWVISQDGTGGRTLAYGTLFKWTGSVAPVVTATAGAKSSITAIYDGVALLSTFTLNYA